MSSLNSSAGAARISTSSIYIPPSGGWRADLTMDDGDLPVGQVTITTGSLTLKGGVEHAAFDAASAPHVVIVGGLGWMQKVTSPISFQSDAGVRLSTVLAEISRGAKQAIQQPTDVTIGDYYEIVASHQGEPVRWRDVLNDLVRGGYISAWRVDPDGVTRFGARASVVITTRAEVLKRDAAVGSTTYGVDDASLFLPGNKIEDYTIGAVYIRETRGKLEVEVRKAEPDGAPTIKDQVYRMVALAFQDSIRTYVVATVHEDGRMDLAAPSDAPHLPEMKNVEPWTLGGTKYEASPGQEVIVAFRDVKKTRPIVIGARLSAGPFAGAARLGDTVTVMLPPATFSGTINLLPASGIVVWAPGQTIGTITEASAKTKVGV